MKKFFKGFGMLLLAVWGLSFPLRYFLLADQMMTLGQVTEKEIFFHLPWQSIKLSSMMIGAVIVATVIIGIFAVGLVEVIFSAIDKKRDRELEELQEELEEKEDDLNQRYEERKAYYTE